MLLINDNPPLYIHQAAAILVFDRHPLSLEGSTRMSRDAASRPGWQLWRDWYDLCSADGNPPKKPTSSSPGDIKSENNDGHDKSAQDYSPPAEPSKLCFICFSFSRKVESHRNNPRFCDYRERNLIFLSSRCSLLSISLSLPLSFSLSFFFLSLPFPSFSLSHTPSHSHYRSDLIVSN